MGKKKARPRSIHGDGSGWNWTSVKRPARPARAFSLAGAITRIVNFLSVDAITGKGRQKRRVKVTQRRRGRRAMARLHPHRYRRR